MKAFENVSRAPHFSRAEVPCVDEDRTTDGVIGLFQAPQYLHVATITPADLDLDQMMNIQEEETSASVSQSASHPLWAMPPPSFPLARRSAQPPTAAAATRLSVGGAESAADVVDDPRWSSAALLTEPAEAGGSAHAAYATPWQVRVCERRQRSAHWSTLRVWTASFGVPVSKKGLLTSRGVVVREPQVGSNAAQDIAATRGDRAAAKAAAERSAAVRAAAAATAATAAAGRKAERVKERERAARERQATRRLAEEAAAKTAQREREVRVVPAGSGLG